MFAVAVATSALVPAVVKPAVVGLRAGAVADCEFAFPAVRVAVAVAVGVRVLAQVASVVVAVHLVGFLDSGSEGHVSEAVPVAAVWDGA